MKIRLLGAHNLETRDTRHTCFLIDGVVAIDAGSLVGGMTPEEIAAVHSLLLTHHHFDHTRDVPTVGLVRRDIPATLDVYGLPITLETTRQHLMDGNVYPDPFKPLNGVPPRFNLMPVKAGVTFQVLDYEVKPLAVSHPVPAVGYILSPANGGVAVAFTGDTGGDLSQFFRDPAVPKLLFVDMTFPTRQSELAWITGHLTPGTIRDQLISAKNVGMPLPKIVAVHRGLGNEEELLKELDEVASALEVDLIAGHEGMVFDL